MKKMLTYSSTFFHRTTCMIQACCSFFIQSVKCCISLIFFTIFFGEIKAQTIVETFENAAWTSLTSAGAATSGTIGTTFAATTTGFNITTNGGTSFTNSVATTLTGNVVTGNYTWAYSKASVLTIPTGANSASLSLVHSYKTVLAITSSGGYLICPVLPTGIATVSFWSSKTGGGFGGTLALNTNVTTANTYASTDFNLSTIQFTSGGAGRVSTILSPNFTGPCGIAFKSNGMWIDDIVITPSLSGVKTGTAGSITTNSAIISANVLENGSASAVTVSGVCWSDTQGAESISGAKTTDGATSNGSFTGSLTGLASGTTYYVRAYATNSNGTYYGPEISFTTTAVIDPEPTNQPTGFATDAITTANIPLTWTSAVTGTQAPHGYLVKASNTATPAEPVDATDPGVQINLSGGTATAKATPQSSTGYSGFTNLTAGTMYYFRVNSYTNSGANINFVNTASSPTNPGPTVYAATLPNAVTSPVFTISGSTGSISWAGASGYSNINHTTLVFIKATSSITVGTPTNAPSTYTDNPALTSGTAYQADAAAHCIYKGDGTTASVTGLAAGISYYVLILVVVDAANSNTTNSYSAAATVNASTPSEYTWDGSTSTDWAEATNWTPDRSSPLSTDILNFNTGASVSITNFTAATYGSISKLKISNNTNVTINAGSSQTLTITSVNGTDADLEINAGSSLITQASRVNITLGASTIADISGTLTLNSGTTYNTDAANAVSTVSGLLDNSGTVTSTAASKLVVTSTGTYRHNVNGGTIPTGTWNTGSTCQITGITSAQNMNGQKQTFSKFVWDCPSQSATHFVLGENSSSSAPNCVITDSFIVKRTNGKILQITSSGGQRDFVVGNFFQYGGIVAITYNTDDGGTQRSLTVTNTFYVTDSIVSGADFQIINQPSAQNITGRLFVNGIVNMHSNLSSANLSRIGTASKAEIIFGGTSNQPARFNNINGDIDFIINNPVSVTLGSDAKTCRCKLQQGSFFIGSNTLTINGAVSYPSPSTGLFAGSITSNLSIGSDGHAKNDTTNILKFLTNYKILKNFSLFDTCKATLGTALAITAGSAAGALILDTSAILTTNDSLTLNSDANGTARIAPIPVNASGVALGTISGKVTVERYLPMNTAWDSRRWRLLTAPVSGNNNPSLWSTWQESATPTTSPGNINSSTNPNPGYGTHITRSPLPTNNFDAGSTSNPSIYYMSSGSWVTPTATNGTTISSGLVSPITGPGGYMIFVRGDRSIVISTPYINTTGGNRLRAKGEMNTGNVSIPITGGKQIIGNPYASAISFNDVSYKGTTPRSKTGMTFYLWDPKLLGSKNVGGFVTFSSNGTGASNTYTYVPYTGGAGGMSAFTNAGIIESGSAFMIDTSAGGNFVFHETDKLTTSATIGIASRPIVSPSLPFAELYTNLYANIGGDDYVLADGVATLFGENFNNVVDDQDAGKAITFTSKEKISLWRDNALLSIERRNNITVADTIYFSINSEQNRSYQLRFINKNFDPSLKAYVIDQYKKTATAIAIDGSDNYNFTTDNDVLSVDKNRFYIIFRLAASGPLPIRINSIQVDKKNTVNDLKWVVENQQGVKSYEVEKSADGINFITVATILAGSEMQYNYLDQTVGNRTDFYRIKIVSLTGNIYYSPVVTISRNNTASSINIYPNIITNGLVTLQLNNTIKGKYDLQLINDIGQLILKKQIIHIGGNAVISIETGKLSKGVYQLKIILPDSQEKGLKVLY